MQHAIVGVEQAPILGGLEVQKYTGLKMAQTSVFLGLIGQVAHFIPFSSDTPARNGEVLE